jgi:hypothetical protein
MLYTATPVPHMCVLFDLFSRFLLFNYVESNERVWDETNHPPSVLQFLEETNLSCLEVEEFLKKIAVFIIGFDMALKTLMRVCGEDVRRVEVGGEFISPLSTGGHVARSQVIRSWRSRSYSRGI